MKREETDQDSVSCTARHKTNPHGSRTHRAQLPPGSVARLAVTKQSIPQGDEPIGLERSHLTRLVTCINPSLRSNPTIKCKPLCNNRSLRTDYSSSYGTDINGSISVGRPRIRVPERASRNSRGVASPCINPEAHQWKSSVRFIFFSRLPPVLNTGNGTRKTTMAWIGSDLALINLATTLS
jgi:hypothetical protein